MKDHRKYISTETVTAGVFQVISDYGSLKISAAEIILCSGKFFIGNNNIGEKKNLFFAFELL